MNRYHSIPLPNADQPVGEWPALPPNFWRSHVTPRVVEYAYTFHTRGVGYAADHMWSNKNFAK